MINNQNSKPIPETPQNPLPPSSFQAQSSPLPSSHPHQQQQLSFSSPSHKTPSPTLPSTPLNKNSTPLSSSTSYPIVQDTLPSPLHSSPSPTIIPSFTSLPPTTLISPKSSSSQLTLNISESSHDDSLSKTVIQVGNATNVESKCSVDSNNESETDSNASVSVGSENQLNLLNNSPNTLSAPSSVRPKSPPYSLRERSSSMESISSGENAFRPALARSGRKLRKKNN